MIHIPNSEAVRFRSVIYGQAEHFNMSVEEYLRKIWYHEQASRLGEYVAMSLLNEVLPLVPSSNKETAEKTG